LLADENLNHDVVRGLRRARPDLDLLTVREAGLVGASDPDVLAWAADQGRVVVSHDVQTLVGFAYERVAGGQGMPGVIIVSDRMDVGRAIEDVLIVVECSDEGELEGQVRFVPI
jgi:hypothetical protein